MSNPIPTITLTDTPACAAALLDAAQTLGFVYITLDGSGLAAGDIDGMFTLSQSFFALPDADKAACAITAANKGWSSVGSETLDPATQKRGDFKQAFNIGEFTPASEPQQPLPPLLSAETPRIAAFSRACHTLCTRLLRLFAVALELPSTYFDASHDSPALGPSGSILRLLYYPPPPAGYAPGDGDMRAGAHSDYGSVTLLFQRAGQGGLEILAPGGGWKAVPVVEGAVCVNIGDLLSYWTAGLLRSTVHRVVAPEGETGERYSVVYFCHPVDSTPLAPMPSRVVQERGRRGANDADEGGVLTASEHLAGRLAATYGWGKKDDAAE
ncbi:hypothetical protein EDC01DRAFT_784347 [Geopyxis carbonaria]|nr:hypothetical protein EDC01DRAFT_784347 [Geopyxis carbonaria]